MTQRVPEAGVEETDGLALANPPISAHIERLWAFGRGAWAAFTVTPQAFAEFTAERPTSPIEFAADLYLACACAGGDRAAHAAYVQAYRGLVERAARRVVTTPDAVDEVVQDVLTLLLHGRSGEPRIARYAGRGPLASFTAVVASRAGLDAVRRTRRESAHAAEGLHELRSPLDDAELGYMKQVYRAAFRDAFAAALAALSTRARLVLRYHVDGLGIDAIAALHGVHRVTANRWLARARSNLMRGTRARLMRRAGLSESEFESVNRLILSQLDVSLARLLAEAEPP